MPGGVSFHMVLTLSERKGVCSFLAVCRSHLID